MSKITSESQARSKTSASRILILVIGLLIAAAIVSLLAIRRANESRVCLRLEKSAQCVLDLEFARTPQEQEKGLSNRDALGANSGLIFSFVKSERKCFWMKDMKFPIDIIWMNSQKQILHIEYDVKPESFPKTYCPVANAQYVLEVNAGQTKELGLNLGQQLFF